MAIIVDKEAKRRDIALSCRDLLQENGIENLTIAQIAQTAGVGKGTIYEYFENKEDIVFEIITTLIHENVQRLQKLSRSPLSTREKLFQFGYSLFDGEAGDRHLKLFKDFTAVSLIRQADNMLRFSEQTRTQFHTLLEHIIHEGIERGELEARFQNAANSLIIFSTGLMIDSRLPDFDVRKELNDFLDLLFPTPLGDSQ